MEMQWLVQKAFNTETGFKEWLEDKGVLGKAKRQEIVNRLKKGETIEKNDWRLRYQVDCELGVFYFETRG